jgi:hypothetical protein
MPGDPEECRKHATNCRDMAEATVSPLAKARFEELARTWIRLANDLEQVRRWLSTGAIRGSKSGCVQPERAALVCGMSADQ